MKEFLLFVVLPAFALTGLFGLWNMKLKCIVHGCEPPHGKYCGYCGKRQPTQSSGGEKS